MYSRRCVWRRREARFGCFMPVELFASLVGVRLTHLYHTKTVANRLWVCSPALRQRRGIGLRLPSHHGAHSHTHSRTHAMPPHATPHSTPFSFPPPFLALLYDVASYAGQGRMGHRRGRHGGNRLPAQRQPATDLTIDVSDPETPGTTTSASRAQAQLRNAFLS